MKKFLALTIVLCSASTAAIAGVPGGEATYHVNLETKSTASRAEVVAKTDSSNISNFQDASVSPKVVANPMLSRSEVVRKMEGYKFADFGDGTNLQPWVKKFEAPRSLATDETSKSATRSN